MPQPTFDELREAARESKWDFVDAHLTEGVANDSISRLLSELQLDSWAADLSDEERDFTATVLMMASVPFSHKEMLAIKKKMAEDPYNIVQYRLAMALYKRDDRSEEVLRMMHESDNNPDTGELSREMRHHHLE